MRVLLLIALCGLVGTAFAGAEDPCSSRGTPAAGIIEITGGTADSTVYLDDRNVAMGNGDYVYLESNTIWSAKLPGVYVGDVAGADLQRGERWCNGVLGGWPFCAFDDCLDPSPEWADTEMFSLR